MHIKKIFAFLFSALLLIPLLNTSCTDESAYDVIIYGGTSGGIAAAIQAKRMGKTVLVIEDSPTQAQHPLSDTYVYDISVSMPVR